MNMLWAFELPRPDSSRLIYIPAQAHSHSSLTICTKISSFPGPSFWNEFIGRWKRSKCREGAMLNAFSKGRLTPCTSIQPDLKAWRVLETSKYRQITEAAWYASAADDIITVALHVYCVGGDWRIVFHMAVFNIAPKSLKSSHKPCSHVQMNIAMNNISS